MEREKKSLSLFILLRLLLVCSSDECPSLPDNLTCYNDYSRNITCLWNSTHVTDDTETACTIHAKYQSRRTRYSASCHLEPVDISRPALKTCSLIFEPNYTFTTFHVLSFNLSCNHVTPVITSYQPSCHIRVNPPGKPEVNFTTVSWLSGLSRHIMINLYDSELQWKQQDQSWSVSPCQDPAVQKKLNIQCERECKAELDPDLLIQDERYEARVRVRSVFRTREGAWSDWSPTASWVSPVGKPKPPSDLTCYNDYSRNITCLWNSTHVTDHTETACTIHAKYQSQCTRYSASCHLEPVDISRPALKTCSLIFERNYTFSSFHVLSFNLSCNHVTPVITSYQPSCHIRVNPPGRPEVNFTTVSWLSELSRHFMINLYDSELQWKQQDQSWSDPAVQKKLNIQCERECEAELDPDLLLRDETYEARVRVRSVFRNREGAWSDWSPTASWVSPVGKLKPPSGIAFIVPIIIAGVVVLLVFILLCTTCGFSLHFPTESFHSFLKPVEIITVELASSVDAVTACRPDEKIVINKGSYDSTSSGFSNPSYSELCTPPISSLSAGNLKPCATDTPYGPVGTQGGGKSTEQESNEAREKENEMVKSLLKGSSNSEPVQVIPDYEKSEKVNTERFRLQSLDSGMSSS